MGEVSELTGLAPHVLRNWEKTYPQLKPKKNSAGNRAYKEPDLQLIFKIKALLEEKYTSNGVKRVLEGGNSEPQKIADVSSEMKKNLTEMKVFLNHLLEKL